MLSAIPPVIQIYLDKTNLESDGHSKSLVSSHEQPHPQQLSSCLLPHLKRVVIDFPICSDDVEALIRKY